MAVLVHCSALTRKQNYPLTYCIGTESHTGDRNLHFQLARLAEFSKALIPAWQYCWEPLGEHGQTAESQVQPNLEQTSRKASKMSLSLCHLPCVPPLRSNTAPAPHVCTHAVASQTLQTQGSSKICCILTIFYLLTLNSQSLLLVGTYGEKTHQPWWAAIL